MGAKATLEKLENQDIEIGLLQYMRAENAFERAARQYQRYEDRVMSGAGLAVKWLEPREVCPGSWRRRRFRAAASSTPR